MAPPSSNDPLNDAYAAWQKNPNTTTLMAALAETKPVVDRILRQYGDSPSRRAEAKLLIVKAFQNYDPARKVPLKNWIYTQLQPMRRVVAKEEPGYIPERVRAQAYELKTRAQELEGSLGRPPSNSELADALGLSTTVVQQLRQAGRPTIYADTLQDVAGNPYTPGTEKIDARKVWMDYVYHDMSPDDRYIYEAAQSGTPQKELAKQLKVSPSAVSQRMTRIAGQVQQRMTELESSFADH